jgi:hypothetical protein
MPNVNMNRFSSRPNLSHLTNSQMSMPTESEPQFVTELKRLEKGEHKKAFNTLVNKLAKMEKYAAAMQDAFGEIFPSSLLYL